MIMLRKLKKVVLEMIFQYIYFKSKIIILLYGINGIMPILEKLPEVFIIRFMQKYGLKIGSNSRILPGVLFNHLAGKKPFENLVIGDNVYIGRNVLFDLSSTINLQDDCAIGAGSQVWTHVGDYTYDFSDYSEFRAAVTLGKGVLCWSRVIISPGVSIGDYTRVASGAVIVSNLESGSFYGGVPAKFISKRKIDQLHKA